MCVCLRVCVSPPLSHGANQHSHTSWGFWPLGFSHDQQEVGKRRTMSQTCLWYTHLELFALVVGEGLEAGDAITKHGQRGLHGLAALRIRHLHDLTPSLTHHRDVLLDGFQLWEGLLQQPWQCFSLLHYVTFLSGSVHHWHAWSTTHTHEDGNYTLPSEAQLHSVWCSRCVKCLQ